MLSDYVLNRINLLKVISGFSFVRDLLLLLIIFTAYFFHTFITLQIYYTGLQYPYAYILLLHITMNDSNCSKTIRTDHQYFQTVDLTPFEPR